AAVEPQEQTPSAHMEQTRPSLRRLRAFAQERVRPGGSDPCQLVEVADGTRTHDHLDHNQGLYRLSYRHRGQVRIAALAGAAGVSRLGRRGPRLDGLLLLLVLPLGELLDHLL